MVVVGEGVFFLAAKSHKIRKKLQQGMVFLFVHFVTFWG